MQIYLSQSIVKPLIFFCQDFTFYYKSLALKKISVRNSLDDSLTIPSPPLIWENSEKKAPKFNQHNEQLRKEFNETKK